MMNEYNMCQPDFIYLTYGTLDASNFCISLNTYLSTFYFCSNVLMCFEVFASSNKLCVLNVVEKSIEIILHCF
jgi:hypothetical protein